MLKIMRTPSRYVQGKDSLLALNEQTSPLGKSLFIIASKTAMKVTRTNIEKSFEGTGKKLVFERFKGVSSMSEVNRLMELVKSENCDIVAGVGGGSTLDTAKAVAFYLNKPVVIIPTVAATDSPCTALSVIYTDEGKFEKYLFYPKNPDVVLVDTNVLANAPVRFTVAGMGDALGTYFEGRACFKSNSLNLVNGSITNAGLSLAKLCYETLRKDGFKAKAAIESGAITKAVDNVIEANIFLSGVGAENAGLAAAHSIYNGFTVLKECENTMHGELVAFGTIVQLILENSPIKEIEEVIDFCKSVGLPIMLEGVGVDENNKDNIMKAAKAACAEGETIHNIQGDVTYDELYDALLAANALGKKYK